MATPEKTARKAPAPASTVPDLAPDEVLHSPSHSRLTTEEIAKAVARHRREHPANKQAKHL